MIEPARQETRDEFRLKFIDDKSGPELAHLLGEDPERPVQAHAAIDAADLARADAAPLRAAAGLAATHGVLLHLCAGHAYVLRRLVGVIPSSESS
jgi:hypothetical protein